MLAGWLRQGTESFFASQRILTDLVMRQNAHTIGAFQGRLTEARNIAGAAATEMAGEGISSFIAAQRVLLNLAQRQNELLTTVVKERIDGPAPVAAVTDLFSRGVDTVIGMHQHLLTMAARQTDEWIDATKSGEPFEGIHLGDTNGRHSAARKTELAELARQSAEAYIDAQKKLLDVAAQQLKLSAKTTREAINAINPLPMETLTELARHTLEGLVESEQDLVNVIVKPLVRPLHQAPKAHAAAEEPKPRRKRPVSARRKPVAETA
jgi:hypothetical protein